ncbi:MAG: 6-bladed beta-propeller [bacterium]|nr:6-bladed beta-propeller [bacterium]
MNDTTPGRQEPEAQGQAWVTAARLRQRNPGAFCLLFVLLTLSGPSLLSTGCSQALRPIFESVESAPAWPPPPTEPRIRYVGQLRSSADLKAPPKLFQALGDFFIGAADPDVLYGPQAVVCTPDGERVWVADSGGRCVHQFDLSARSYLKINRVGAAPLLSPVDVCLGPGGSIFVCDSEGVDVYRFSDKTGALIETLRLPEDIIRPVALGWAAEREELFVVDVAAHDIKVLGADGLLRRIIGRRGAAAGEFNFPCDVVLDGELIWVVDAGNARVQGLTLAGDPVAVLGRAGDAPGDLALPKSIALDSDGDLYVVDARFENVQIFDRQGRLLLFFGGEGTGPGEFWLPAGVFIDKNNRIWICDTYNGRVQVFDYLSAPDRVAGGEGATPAVPPQAPASSGRRVRHDP